MDTYKKQLKVWAKRRERIVALFDSGWTRADIARRLGITRQRVYQIVKEAK